MCSDWNVQEDKSIVLLIRCRIFDEIMNKSFGCLIYLLEDEKMEIRIKTVEILKKLSRYSQNIDQEIKELLYDMLNDENDKVRIKAVNAITQIQSGLIQLNT